MHGEYKTPGGKLVIVDFNVVEARLRDVMVSGDFFLYPDDALAEITASLEGAEASLTQAQFADLVQGGIRPGVDLIGTSAEGIAIAARRALDTA